MKKRARRLAKELKGIPPEQCIPLKLREYTLAEKRRLGMVKPDYAIRLWNKATYESVPKFGKAWINENGTITSKFNQKLEDRLKLTDPKWILVLVPWDKENRPNGERLCENRVTT